MQIDSSVSGRGLVTSCGATAYHKLPRHQMDAEGSRGLALLPDPACQPFGDRPCRVPTASDHVKPRVWLSPRRPRCRHLRSGRPSGQQPKPPPAGPTGHRRRRRHAGSLVPIGAGFDTSRYGHDAAFLRADLQPAAADLKILESALGYQQLRQRLDAIAAKHAGHVHFHMRLDVAGCYADNLLAFLQALPYRKTISCGDPERNKNYRVAIFGSKKSDPVEAHACARFAITEAPKATPTLTPAMRILAQIASRLESQARQNTRVLNQLHNLLARTFPEFALLVKDLAPVGS